MEKRPWEIVPAFTEERLTLLAEKIIRVRADALRTHDPTKGDGLWSLGCRVYERTIKQLSREAMSGSLPWLRATIEGLYVTLRIDGWPLRVYRGSADSPTYNSLRAGQKDLEIQPELPGMPTADKGWFWLMAVDTDRAGKAKDVVVEQANANGATRNQWTVPIRLDEIQGGGQSSAGGPASADVISLVKPQVEVGPPEVGIKESEEKEETK